MMVISYCAILFMFLNSIANTQCKHIKKKMTAYYSYLCKIKEIRRQIPKIPYSDKQDTITIEQKYTEYEVR